ncbi:tetratricopeptide repeat protein [Leptospira wolffii]|uniref:Tetratricopeptide repeat protein n=1 Tax=Leptospira wolffii TaxID=409998 RepID=A0ABV5BSJ0_9LEPT|nr:tetratricopeptide repeat protein [Leptospira wolffii]EPG67634.1 tetratricopeptide repeat protein [Leptospira wolffii serovar Khorat str. Khorat-H2]TGL51864.1 hypothetical protein EHQ61_07840 [Leptospira wolffii]
MKRFEPKTGASIKDLDPYADLTGAERAFAILFSKIGEHKKPVLIGLIVLIVTVVSVVGWNEYRADQFRKGTIAVEILEKELALKPNTDLAEKIKRYEAIQSTYHSSPSLELRLSKTLGDLYARNGEFAKAADKLEWAGKQIDELPEVKAYYFYIAGNYRESGNQLAEAESDYFTASSLLAGRKNISGFYAWSLYQAARLKVKNGKKDEAKELLKKVLEQDISSPSEEFKSVKELATYLLLKTSQGN